ncbi:hypothetical protein KY285_011783 [Solanum tuberosum]|nr:hypothetical protein KY285_011783 [Solanum tuberosum]
MRTGNSRQMNRRNSNTEAPRKEAFNSNLRNKRKKNGKCQKKETINHMRKEYRGQYGDQPHHKTNCQRSNHKPQHNLQEHNSHERTTPQRAQSKSKTDHNKKTQVKQTGNKENNKSTGIDSMLPIPIDPNIPYFDDTIEVEGGMDGGCQEKQTNMQEVVSNEGNLTHVMHQGTHWDHSTRPRTPATTTSQHQRPEQQQLQHQKQPETGNNREKEQEEVRTASKQNKGSMEKDIGANASTSNQGETPKIKNKHSKKKREAPKKKQNLQPDSVQQREQQNNGESCKKFVMVDEHLGMDITPLQAQYMTPPTNVPPDKRVEKCQMNKGPIIDEYTVDNSEDELDVDNQSLKDPDEDDETSELLIRAFSPHPDQGLENEIQQVASQQGLSPRGIHHDRFQFKAQDINTVTAGRPNTRLFTTRSSL